MTELSAQSVRYRLGERLKRFEVELESNLSEPHRRPALAAMQNAVTQFFAGQMIDAGSQLDAAWIALLPAEQHDLARWAAPLAITPESPLLTDQDDVFRFRFDHFYESQQELPTDVQLVGRWTRHPDQAKLGSVGYQQPCQIQPVDQDWATVTVTEKGQYELQMFVELGQTSLPIGSTAFAKMPDFQNRIEQLQTALTTSGGDSQQPWLDTPKATIKERLRIMAQWQSRNDLETSFYGAVELDRLQRLAKHAGDDDWFEQAFGKANGPNGFDGWLRVAGEKRQKAIVRLFVPEIDDDSQRPCVIAMHGAGGSENMFFDGYGAGKVVKLCRERGWFVVAPRITLTGVGLDLPDLIKQLSDQLPIDQQRVFVMGHSIGAGFTIRSVSQLADRDDDFRFAAAAVIGGGTPANWQADFAAPSFVAAGQQDFGKRGAKAFHQSMEDRDLSSQYREYPATEHMAIVQIAMEDVFSFFDQYAK